MEIVLAQDTDAKRWNEYVSKHAHASPYHLFAWKQSVEDAYDQQGYYLMALDDNHQIVGVLPTVLIKPPLLSATLCSLPYCDRGEALADSTTILEQLIDRANQFREQLKAQRYEYRSAQLPDDETEASLANAEPQKVRMILPLPETSAELLAGFKTKLRSQVKKAEKNGLTYEIGNNLSLVSDFYAVFTTNMRDLGSPTHSKRWFESIRQFYAEKFIISVIKYNDIPIGAGIILLTEQGAAIPWASTLRKYNRLAPNMILYWSLLQHATDSGCQYFDFGRSTIGEGTFKFKQQWGAKPVKLNWKTYPEADQKKHKNDALKQTSTLRQSAENVWKKIPLPLTVTIGSRVRKYISL